jgi:hypothetical protein
VETFELMSQPITIDYDEFEAIILALAFHQYSTRKLMDPPFEEYLGELMDRIFRTAGVLVDFPQD